MKVILVVVLLYILYRLVFRRIIINMMHKKIQSFANQFVDSNVGEDNLGKPQEEGTIIIDHAPRRGSAEKKVDTGEYVDFEEIKD